MEILSCSAVQYNGESNCPEMGSETNFCNGGSIEHEKQVQVADVTHEVGYMILNEGDRPSEEQGIVDEIPNSEGICIETSNHKNMEYEKESPCSLNYEEQNNEPWVESDIPLNEEKFKAKLPSSNRDGESHIQEAKWLEQEETVALWVKWRGKWQAGIRCARADCPLSTLKARPTHDRKQYFVVFFPQTRNYSWADMLLVRPIHEFPDPIAHRTHSRGVAKVKDLSLPRRFIIQKLAISMVNVSDRLHNEALIESAREVTAWKEFAMEASRCEGYSDLGRMLLKLQTMILQQFIDPNWLQNSFASWVERCLNSQSAESVETLKEELVNFVLWNEIEALWDVPMQPELGHEWKTWKQEVMKWFSLTKPIAREKGREQPHGDSSTCMDHQISRKRPKLEVRRAEMHASLVEASTSHEEFPRSDDIEIDSGFFDREVLGNANTSLSDHCSNTFTERSAPSEDPGTVPDRGDKIVVEAENPVFIQTAEVAEAPNYNKPLDLGNKYRQCMAIIEAKGRQCVRWANEDSVYCCVHLATRSVGKSADAEQTHPSDAPMCEGTTTHGTKCKHRSRFGSPFCKKHGLQENQSLVDMEKPLNSPGNTFKRKHIEMSSETASGKEIVLFREVQNPVPVNSVSLTVGETSHSFIEPAAFPLCVGLYHENNNAFCPERAKLHTLYCEKHLPSWLKRARNGKSRIISKEIFSDLLRACSSQKQKLHLHQACELLYGFVKTILHRRNPVPKETQLQWILSEASKDIRVGEWLMKLVSREREKLNTFWSFDDNKDKPLTSSSVEQSALVVVVPQSSNNNDNQNNVKCKICVEEFPDDQVLGTHWMETHKKEAQQLFRGYACTICMNSFTNKKVLETHVVERHENQSLEQCILFQCIPCGTHFMSPQQLWSHVLTIHSNYFKLPAADQQHYISPSQTPQQLELSNGGSVGSEGAARRFSCRFCGLKFDILPDLGRHHQAAHMVLDSTSNTSSKKGAHVNPYKLKSGRPSHTSLTKGLGAASYRIRNRGNLRIKKPFQASSLVSTEGLRVQTQVAEEVGLGRLVESQCSSVARFLFSEIQKTKPRPSNLDILSVARSTCCKKSLIAALEKKYGVLPERLHLKAAKLCSELNIQVEWHQEGYICSKGCMSDTTPSNSSTLVPLPSEFMELQLATTADTMKDEEWEMDECHCILESRHIKLKPISILLFEDVTFGKESIPVACVVDENLLGSLHSTINEGSNGKTTGSPSPWEGFTYVTERLLDPSLGLATKSTQLGCACPHSTCSAEACDHVYLFDNDYEDAEDINGQSMHGRFPYDEKGRIVLKERYLVYECNSMCSCDKSCRNRILQKGVKIKLEVFKTEKKGWAVRAGEAISRGTFVCEYIGEVINDQEATKRAERYANEGCSYLYRVDSHFDNMSELIEGGVSYVIDATRYGNVSRFINHSCSPNLVIYRVLVESMDCQLAHIGLYASRDIAEGEELAYDYHHELCPEGGGCPCFCGASKCRGRL